MKQVLIAIVLVAALASARPTKAEQLEARAITVPSRDIQVVSQVGGVIEEVLVEEGERVQRGEPLVRLDSGIQEAVLAISEQRARSTAKIDSARANLTRARAAWERTQTLYEREVASDADLEEAQADLIQAESALKAAQEQQALYKLEAARDRAVLERMTVRAPVSGLVVRRLKDAGEAAEQYGPVVQLVVLDPLHVIAYVPAERGTQISPDTPARFCTEQNPEDARPCTVLTVDPVVDAASSTRRIKLSLPNGDGQVASGLRGRVLFGAQPTGGNE